MLAETRPSNRSAGSRERGRVLTSSTGHDAAGDEVEYRPVLTAQTLADGEHSFDKRKYSPEPTDRKAHRLIP